MAVNIIIPYYKNFETIDRLLWSINEQDYKDFDVTIVVDGIEDKPDSSVEEFMKAFNSKYDFDVQYKMLSKNHGANSARNLGASLTNKEILFFIDADCELYPGMLRECVNQLEQNADIDFVYGNYRFEDRSEYVSQPFDPYLLETMNYIPTMSPMRRSAFEAVDGFIENQEYFQDWSLFYRMSKNGSKGKWIDEFIFSTKEPNEDNISGKQGTLNEKATKFRKEHGISDKELVTCTFGAPLQAIQRAKMLDADYVGLSKNPKRFVSPWHYEFEKWKGTYLVGLYNQQVEALENHLANVIGKPLIHMIGTDVFQLMTSHSFLQVEQIAKMLKDLNAHVFCNSMKLEEELTKMNIPTELLYTPVYDMEQYKTSPLPEQFTVGVYFSDSNPMHALEDNGGLTNIPLVLDAAFSMPDIKFKLFGGKGVAFKKKNGFLGREKDNVEIVGRIPENKMPEFISSCSMVLRSTVHDGFPQLPIQFMLSGRRALVSYTHEDLKYANRLSFEMVTDYEKAKNEIIDKVYDIADKKPLSERQVKAVQNYYKELLNPQTFKKRIYEVLNA